MDSLNRLRRFCRFVLLTTAVTSALAASPARAEDATGLRADAHAALAALYKQVPAAKALGDEAQAVLVFPNVVKAGFIV